MQCLVTSRALLRVAGEQEYEVSPLPVRTPADEPPDPAEGNLPSAVRLFADRARAIDANFTITEENRAVIESICASLDGLPLGIELAAARVNLLSPRAILERLDRQWPLPGRATRDAPERQRTAAAAIGGRYH